MEHFEKSIIPVIESVYPSFTPLERTVADFFIHNTDESDLSARHVSELLYVSEASLSRFAKKCGYTGYREFVYRYQEGLNAALPGTDDHIKQVLNTYQELLNKSYSLADRAQIDPICHILTSKRRVYVYGLGSSGLSAQEMKLRFMLAGVDIEAITDIHIMKMNAVLLNESCAAIGIQQALPSGDRHRRCCVRSEPQRKREPLPFSLLPAAPAITMPSAMKSCCLRSKSI